MPVPVGETPVAAKEHIEPRHALKADDEIELPRRLPGHVLRESSDPPMVGEAAWLNPMQFDPRRNLFGSGRDEGHAVAARGQVFSKAERVDLQPPGRLEAKDHDRNVEPVDGTARFDCLRLALRFYVFQALTTS
nr:hypothetical protein [Georhizobium profundi]